MANFKLSCVLVMPVYNEEECISDVIRNWYGELQKTLNDSFKIIAVNDGSKDSTGKILENLASELTHLLVIQQENAGHGAAVLAGYQRATTLKSEFVFQTDSDNQFDATDFSKLWNQRNLSEFILGVREFRQDALNRLIITRVLKVVVALAFGVWIRDVNVPFRLIRSTYLERLLTIIPPHPFAPNIFLSTLAATEGKNLLNIPVLHRGRTTGTVSILNFKLLRVCFRSFKELLEFRWTLRNLRHNTSEKKVS